jgi:hypothetical protein
LHLAPVNARLEIEKLPRQMQPRLAPMQPEVIGGKTHQHGTHAKVDPAGCVEAAHAGVHHREAGVATAPSLEIRGVEFGFAQTVVGARKVVELDARFIFELLHEVAMPAQPPGKTAQVIRHAARRRLATGLQGANALLGGLMHLPHGERAEGQMRAQARAALRCRERAGQIAPVLRAPRVQKAVQGGERRRRARIGRGAGRGQAQVAQGRKVARCQRLGCVAQALR